MAQAIIYMIQGIKPKKGKDGSIWRDAKLFEATMKGWGTRDGDLIYRLTRARWNSVRFHLINEAYERKYGTSLAKRIKGETSGEYRDILMLLFHSSVFLLGWTIMICWSAFTRYLCPQSF